jgi:serine/threonine protein kinase
LTEFSSPDLGQVGNYTLGRLIGKGSFGKVYLASHKLTNGSRVVLKSAKKDDANLAREIHHHRQFLHPHIARLYEVIVTESLVWLVLEYCPGDELYNHLLKNGRMEVPQVQKIFTQLVGAVSYVHAKQCVHRDLKLENILLDKHGNVKLVDFGFTREYQGSTSYLQTWCGTVCYSAPEMLKGEKYAGEKVDVWSLGIILFALLSGELPFDDDEESVTKGMILRDEPIFPEHVPEPAKELIKKLLSKRPLLRPSLSDVLKDPWLAEHAPQQQEILKLQQPAPFSTQLEKDTLQRMRSAGVDIDMVIENVLSQRCDGLAGWWALLIEKETRKERRRERKRKEREADAKSIRRLSAASNRLLAQSALLGEINEGNEAIVDESPHPRGRRSRRNASVNRRSQVEEMPQVAEGKSDTPPPSIQHTSATPKLPEKDGGSRSRSRPPPPPKDGINPVIRRPRNMSRGSASMLQHVTTNPDLLSPSYVPPPQRKKKFHQQPLKQQLAMFKHWFKESAKRARSPTNADGNGGKSNGPTSPGLFINGQKHVAEEGSLRREMTRTPTRPRTSSLGSRPDLAQRQTMPARPRIVTNASFESRKRQSLSPHTLTPHSSYRRSSGLRGRKSTSSSVSSIRSAYPSVPRHQHTHSKASSTSSTSLASPSGLSATSGSRPGRSPHNSVKLLPATPTNTTFPSGIRVSRRPPPSGLGTLPSFAETKSNAFGVGSLGIAPGSPGLPVFARRKRSVFKGPITTSSSPSGLGRVPMGTKPRSGSLQGQQNTEVIGGIQEEEEEEDQEDELVGGIDEDGGILANAITDDDDGKWEDTDQFGPELESPVPMQEIGIGFLAPPQILHSDPDRTSSVGSGPLTQEALRKKDALDEETAASDKAASLNKGMEKVDALD